MQLFLILPQNIVEYVQDEMVEMIQKFVQKLKKLQEKMEDVAQIIMIVLLELPLQKIMIQNRYLIIELEDVLE